MVDVGRSADILTDEEALEEQKKHFERLQIHLQAALKHTNGTHTITDVWNAIENGQAQLWSGVNSVIVTEIVTYPTVPLRKINVWLAGGNLEEIEEMMPPIVEWAKKHKKCTRASLIGRRGWSKSFLKRAGWRETQVIMECEL